MAVANNRINLKKAKSSFEWIKGPKMRWCGILCLPHGYKLSRKAMAYMRKNKFKVLIDKNITNVHSCVSANLTLKAESNTYTLTPGYKNHE